MPHGEQTEPALSARSENSPAVHQRQPASGRARPLRWSRALSAWLAAAALTAVTSTLSAAQVCPRAETGKLGFVVERGDQQKSEVYHLDNGMVRAVMRYNGSVLLERTEYEGLFDLDIGPRRK